MEDLENKARRDFLRYGLILPTLILPSDAEAQRNPRQVFVRDTPSNVKSLPQIEPEVFREEYTPPPEERRLHLEQASKKFQVPTFALKPFESYQRIRFRVEPDKKYAGGLIEEANQSIEHMIRFLGSGYIKKPQVFFEIPMGEKGILPVKVPPILIYLVADLERIKVVRYKVEGAGAIVNSILATNLHGASFQNFPILYNTSSDIVGIIEAPAIEVLHKLTSEYGLRHVRDKSRLNPTANKNELQFEYESRNEKFVHALSMLWLREYAKARSLLTNKELDERFALYEQQALFKGTNQLAQHISRIGVQRAIDLYVNNPDALFKGAGIK